MAQFAHLVNSGLYDNEKNVWLTKDIDLAGNRWIAIGNTNSSNIFTGKFNGNGFTVKNMTYSGNVLTEWLIWGLFGLTRGEISAVKVEGQITIDAPDYVRYFFVGGIAGYNNTGGIIEKCESNVNINISITTIGASDIGGIAGSNAGSIISCTNNGNISMTNGNSSPIGGIAAVSTGTIDRCANYGTLTGCTTFIGGIAGNVYADSGTASVTNSFNAGEIIAVDGKTYLYYGGVVAELSSTGMMKNCFNVGKISGTVTAGSLVSSVGSSTTPLEN